MGLPARAFEDPVGKGIVTDQAAQREIRQHQPHRRPRVGLEPDVSQGGDQGADQQLGGGEAGPPCDRGLSRLLKSDWPRSLEELEAMKEGRRQKAEGKT